MTSTTERVMVAPLLALALRGEASDLGHVGIRLEHVAATAGRL